MEMDYMSGSKVKVTEFMSALSRGILHFVSCLAGSSPD